jgi:hypothetical protein
VTTVIDSFWLVVIWAGLSLVAFVGVYLFGHRLLSRLGFEDSKRESKPEEDG